jgi:RHS repeat-associated protein
MQILPKTTFALPKIGVQVLLIVSCILVAFELPAQVGNDMAEQVSRAPLFQQPLVWVGKEPLSEVESETLLQAINVFRTKGPEAGFQALEKFVSSNPHSAWTPALEVHLAEHDRKIGRYAEALAHWQAAWDATKDGKSLQEQKLAVEAMAGWTRLLASLGEKAQLKTLFAELDARHLPLGTYSTEILETREGLEGMDLHPERSFRCGSFALGHLAMALNCNKDVVQRLLTLDSPDGGFDMAELLEIAKTNGLRLEAVRRPLGAPLVVPSVVHWKLNHYAAIMEKDGELYRVEDPTFEGDVWMDEATINAEASGDFILPKDKVPASWEKISQLAAAKIYGKGGPNIMNDYDDDGPPNCGSDSDSSDDSDDSDCDPPSSNDGAKSGGGNPPGSCCGGDTNSPTGMPQWYVSEPYISLWLKDVPLLYRESNGKWMELRLSYKSRGGNVQSPFMSGFGDNWSCNWLGMLQSGSGYQTNILDYLAGGGQRAFLLGGTPDYKTARSYVNSATWGAFAAEQALRTPAGAQNLYALTNSLLDGTSNFLLTHRIDRYGRLLQQFNYITNGTILQLTNVIDMDGKTNVLAYTNLTYPYLITSVTDPYGGTAYFNYDTHGLLTNIVDAQGMSTHLQYDQNENLTNMITAYGSTRFQFYSVGDGMTTALDRGLLITEASGDKQLFVYEDSAPTDFIDRTAYHWNRAQYATISADWQVDSFEMPTADFELATVEHFLHGDDTSSGGFTVSDTMDQIREPENPALSPPGRPNQIVYTYQGQNGDYIGDNTPGGLKRITSVTINGEEVFADTVNSLGRPTSYTFYNSYNPPAIYTNIYDSTGTILEYQIGPEGELTRGYGYDPLTPDLLTSVTNAEGDVIEYTHDPTTLKLTSTTFPGGMVETNVYYASGPYQGFLAMQADIGFRTNYYSYTNGNVFVQTNALGLVTANTYDNLNRLLSITYPDGTTASNVYHALDIVATKDRLNQWTYYGYNAVRQLLAVTNVNDQITMYDYCGCGSPDEIVQFEGATPVVTYLNYDMGGMVTNVVFPDGYQLSYTYDNFDNAQSIIDGSGNELDINWIQHGLENVPQFANLDGQALFSREYDIYGRVLQEEDRNSVTVTNNYDFLDRLTAREYIGAYPGTTTSGLESFAYSWLGLTNYLDQLGQMTIYLRDSSGRVTAEKDANNEVLQFSYNPENELLTLMDGNSHTTLWNYDQYGQVTNKVDASTVTNFVYQYDPLGRLTNRWTPAMGTTVYRYDPLGNLTNVDYSGGTVSTPSIDFAYDPLNRLTNMVDGVGATAFSWTPGNQLASEVGPWSDDAVSYTYNSARQRSGLSLLQPYAAPWVQTYTYDSMMRLSTLTSPAGLAGAPYGTFSYSYSGGMDRVAQINTPASNNGIATVNWYDALARLYQTYVYSSPYLGGSFDIHNYTYDLGSEVTQQVYNAGNYINYTYDNIGQLKTASGIEPDGVTPRLQEQFGYAYDSAWNLISRTNNALIKTFTVNDLNEITTNSLGGTYTVAGSATEPSSSSAPNGVSSVMVNGGAANLYGDGSFAAPGFSLVDGNNTFTAIGQDTYSRLSTNTVTAYLNPHPAYSYDSNGNLTSDGQRNFAYDDENELIGIWVSNAWSNSFAYDGLQRRRIENDYAWGGSAWLKTNEICFVYDGNLVLQERNQNNLPLTTYTRGIDLSGTLQGAGGIGGLLARSDTELAAPAILFGGNGNSQYVVNSYYHNDVNGNVTSLLNQNGLPVATYEYDPFGNILSKSGPLADINKYRFSSKEWNENAGLYNFGYRFYDPNLQRWLNRDPMGDIGSLAYLAPSLDQEDEANDSDGMTDDEFLSAWTQANQNPFNSIGNDPVNTFDAFGLCDDSVDDAAMSNPGETAKLAKDMSNQLAKEAEDGEEAEAAQQGAKSLQNFQKHLSDLNQGKQRLNKLQKLLNRTKGPKAQQPVKDAIEDEEQQIKGHTKEMRQKWPDLCKKNNI